MFCSGPAVSEAEKRPGGVVRRGAKKGGIRSEWLRRARAERGQSILCTSSYKRNSQTSQPKEASSAPPAPQAGPGRRLSRRFQALPCFR